MEKNKIILFENDGIKLEVSLKDETVWLTQSRMAKLFDKDRKTITRHIQNIYKEKELTKNEVCSLFEHTAQDNKKYKVQYYNLDMIISIGYRVKSKNGVIFRRWANKVLKDYLIKGYAINKKRLDYLEKTIKIIEIANRMDERIEDNDAKEILKVIANYTKALNLLDDYDHREIKKIDGKTDKRKIEYRECLEIIRNLKFKEESSIFALERKNGLKSIINNIYQSYNKQDLYISVEEKGANFLYLIVKNHVFIDGNKRVAAALFIYFLNFYNILYKNNKQVIDNNTLAALTLLIAESNPKEKEIMIDLIMNFLSND